MKTVAAGENYTTVEVDTAEVVKFSFASTSLSVKVIEGDITVALRQGAQAGDDGTITVSEGETEMFNHYRMNVDTYYLTGSGKAVLHASNMVEVNPFEGKGKGGDAGGDTTHYRGTTTTPLENGSTTNPIIIDGESYTAVFSDIVIYGYTEFVFDGTAWSEFGRPFDTVPTKGSTNAVTSDGVYKRTPFARADTGATLGNSSVSGEYAVAIGHASSATKRDAFAAGYYAAATGEFSSAFGFNVQATGAYAHVVGKNNRYKSGDLFEVGNGYSINNTSNILEVNTTSMNVNGDIKINNVATPTPYTTMPTITESMLGKIAMYVGATGGGFAQGCFYVASTDGAVEPTYSWVKIGGGRTETVLWENQGTTNPDTITLSEAVTNFDEIRIFSRYTQDGENIHPTDYIHLANDIVNGFAVSVYWTSADYYQYTFTSSTELARYAGVGYIYAYKIIGIKY